MTRALLFPGLNVGKDTGLADFAQEHREIGQTFREAEKTCPGLIEMMRRGAQELFRPLNALPALMTAGVGVIRALEANADIWKDVICVAGHSFGEYAALCAAGSIDFIEALQLTRHIGEVIEQEPALRSGQMISVLGKEKQPAEEFANTAIEIAQRTGAVISNYNTPYAIAFSGSENSVADVQKAVGERGWKAKIVAAGLPAHSPLMEVIMPAIRKVLENVEIKPPRVPLISYNPVEAITDPADIRRHLLNHVTQSVLWTEAVRYMTQERGVGEFFESGNAGVLTHFHNHIKPAATAHILITPEGLQQFLAPPSRETLASPISTPVLLEARS